MPMRVAVTGVSGYLGQALLARLEAAPEVEAVLGLDIKPPARNTPKLKFVRQAFGDAGLTELFRTHGITHVAHLAFALTAPASEDPRMAMEQMTASVAALLAACRENGVSDLVVASSSVVFGAHPENRGTALQEDAPRRPESDLPYAQQKVAMEDMLSDYAKEHPECRLAVLRVVTIFGPAVQNFISRTMEKAVLVLPKGHNPPWQFVHEEDCAEAFFQALVKPVRGFYHIGSDRPMATQEIIEKLGAPVVRVPLSWMETLGEWGWRRGLQAISENPGCVARYVAYPPILDNQRFKQDAGFAYRWDCAATFRTFADARVTGIRWGWMIPLAMIIVLLGLPVASLIKLAGFLLIGALWYLPLSKAEWIRAAITFAVFFPMDVMSTQQGAFGFVKPDFLNLPYYEPVLWPLLLLTLGRFYPHAPARFDWVVVPLMILFAAPFSLIPDPMQLLAACGLGFALLLARYHTRQDLTFVALMVGIGVVWEHVGVWSGQWRYPGDPWGGVPIWSSVLWGGVAILFYRFLMALTESRKKEPLGGADVGKASA